jgi:16S rRNA C967 or C1407 C5-methylase (RsmB/RsmF family)/NOL1/NOP2/fmu family ribosome biogenesis protein
VPSVKSVAKNMKIPPQIITHLQENFKIDISAFTESHNKTIPVSVRLNPLKPACSFSFANQVPWTNNAHYLHERPIFTNDPLFHAGCYYVQEASSMFVEQAMKQSVDLTKQLFVLDACAAPGGKSTLLASLLNEESLLVSNEVISTRVPSLVHNMAKWGTANSVVSNNDPKDFSRLPDFFDVMVVDAPCSGSGLFRKQEDAIEHWSEENVNHCSLRQQRILHDLLPSLKQDGVLIYSTCSYSKEENENMCDYLCSQFSVESIQIKISTEWGITETQSDEHKAFGYRFFPHLMQGEGFFLACFKKTVSPSIVGDRVQKSKKVYEKLTKDEESAVKQFIKGQNFELINHEGEVIGFREEISWQIKTLLSALKIKKMPLHVGQLKGKDFVPHAYSAYFTFLNQKITKIDVDLETALKYLRKQNFIPEEETKGFTLLTYKNFGIGWMKNLGNRVNNYYPAEWRILKEIF